MSGTWRSPNGSNLLHQRPLTLSGLRSFNIVASTLDGERVASSSTCDLVNDVFTISGITVTRLARSVADTGNIVLWKITKTVPR